MVARPEMTRQATKRDMFMGPAAAMKRFPTGITSTTWSTVAYIMRTVTTVTTTDPLTSRRGNRSVA